MVFAESIHPGLREGSQMTMMSVATLQKVGEALLSSDKIEIPLLDQVVDVMNRSTGEIQQLASKILTEMMQKQTSWARVVGVLECSQLLETKYYALQILETLIQTRWKTLHREQCEGIKSFIVGLVIKISGDTIVNPQVKMYLQKLNLVLVQIVKQEWPKHWPTFMADIVDASKVNDNHCLNNMSILRLLSEEIFDFDGEMTQAKAHHLKEAFRGEFQTVFELCHEVIETSENAALVNATLRTLYRFLSWMPVSFIFETNLIGLLTQKFLGVSMFRCITLKCLTEIVSRVDKDNEQCVNQMKFMLKHSMLQVMDTIDPSVDLCNAYRRGTDADQKFIADLAQFLSTYLKGNSQICEVLDYNPENVDLKKAHGTAMQYMLKISMVDDVEVFKICMDYWNWLCIELYQEYPILYSIPISVFSCFEHSARKRVPRRLLYKNVLSELCSVMITRMVKPEEVHVVEGDQGEAVWEQIENTDSITLYKTMSETLVYLTYLDYKVVTAQMTMNLQDHVKGMEWSLRKLNTLCWAIGSISGAMLESDEEFFLAIVVQYLLRLWKQKRGKDNKAVIVWNIMYVLGQYPRYLRIRYKFLKAVTIKLFEFMHETHEGIQNMACDTFIKIARQCKLHFISRDAEETGPFVDEILDGLRSITCDLSPQQVYLFYEAVGYLISAQSDATIRENLIERLMQLPNLQWDNIILQVNEDTSVMKDKEVIKNAVIILRTNVAACRSIGESFKCQLSKIYPDMLNLYKIISENIDKIVTKSGKVALEQPLLKLMGAVKREILTLVSTWIGTTQDAKTVLENFVPLLFDTVLFDYQRYCPTAREPKVLALLSVIVSQLQSAFNPEVTHVLDAILTCTLDMINHNMEEYPEIRVYFFILLQALIHECFEVFTTLPPIMLRSIVHAILYACQHTMRNVAEIGLEILKDMLLQYGQYEDRDMAQSFYILFFLEILARVLNTVTDSNQVRIIGLSCYAEVLCMLFYTAEFAITKELCPPQTNMEYISMRTSKILTDLFDYLTPDQIRITVKGFFSFNMDPVKMKYHLRDLLVQIKERVGEDTSDLFIEQREKEIQDFQNAKKKVPGMLDHHEFNSDDSME